MKSGLARFTLVVAEPYFRGSAITVQYAEGAIRAWDHTTRTLEAAACDCYFSANIRAQVGRTARRSFDQLYGDIKRVHRRSKRGTASPTNASRKVVRTLAGNLVTILSIKAARPH